MKITLTREEVAFILSQHLTKKFSVGALSDEIEFDSYRAGEFVTWESKGPLPETEISIKGDA